MEIKKQLPTKKSLNYHIRQNKRYKDHGHATTSGESEGSAEVNR
jgi:hypothetical protein